MATTKIQCTGDLTDSTKNLNMPRKKQGAMPLGKQTYKKIIAKKIVEADKFCSRYIRLRDSNHQWVMKCVTCGIPARWNEIGSHCGHWIRRKNWGVRWDERNLHGQCRHCNIDLDGRDDDHEVMVDTIHGPGTTDILRERMAAPKPTWWELDIIIDYYKKKIDEIKEANRDRSRDFWWNNSANGRGDYFNPYAEDREGHIGVPSGAFGGSLCSDREGPLDAEAGGEKFLYIWPELWVPSGVSNHLEYTVYRGHPKEVDEGNRDDQE